VAVFNSQAGKDNTMSRGSNVEERQSFVIEQGCLIRIVATRQGRTYRHRCWRESYQAVAHCIEEHATAGVTTNMLWEAETDVPCSQASVAVAFMKERGCLAVRHRRMFPTSEFFLEDAMIEFCALEHQAAPGDDLAGQ
jgi:hypothetical protein